MQPISRMAAETRADDGGRPGDRACGPGATTAPSAARRTERAPPASGSPAPSGSAAGAIRTGNACGDAPVTLNIWGGYPEMDAVYKKAGEAYTALHPNVTFTVFSTDLRGFEQKLTTALPSNTAVTSSSGRRTSCPGSSTRACSRRCPTTSLRRSRAAATRTPSSQDSSYNDKVVGVPTSSSGTALYYNTDMLAEAGLSGPPTTMDQIWANAKKLADDRRLRQRHPVRPSASG